jgi:hypothetical protein
MGCVCNADSDCCGVQWDEACVDLVASCGIFCPCGDGVCDADEGETCAACASDCGTCEGSCCEAHESLGCEDQALLTCVCSMAPSCCDGPWTQACVDATSVCEGACPSCGDGACTDEAGEGCADCPDDCGYCTGAGDCCATREAPGCGDGEVQACVCGLDSDCCELQWDEACVTAAETECELDCFIPECLTAGDCDDDNPCTLSDCQEGLCAHLPQGGICDDGDPCTLGDVCQSGACSPGEAMACDDDNPCTADACEEGECVHTATPDVPCEGSGATICTAGFACGATGMCKQILDDCDDGNPDTFDSCHVHRGCAHVQAGLIRYDAGWIYDTKTKLGWYYDGSLKNYGQAQTTCAALEMPGVTHWTLPKIDPLRGLIQGCSDTETGGTCPLTDPSCLDAGCGGYGMCTACAPGVGGVYLKTGFTPPGLLSPSNLFSRSPVKNVANKVWAVGLSSGSVYQREKWWKTFYTGVADLKPTWVFSWGSFSFSWP